MIKIAKLLLLAIILISSTLSAQTCTFTYGSVDSDAQLVCPGTAPFPPSLDVLPTGGSYTCQWYYADGDIIPCPVGNNTTGWTLIPGATSTAYIAGGLSQSRTFACMIIPVNVPNCFAQWAAGCKHVTVLYPSLVNFGTIESGDETVIPFASMPDTIEFSIPQSGPILNYTYKWYYKPWHF
ncbi:MAG: hypothetical protein M0D57_08655 [Sphingobacteriales bacterium JAD_PAG50586_3]|nr:MAG: hypothetical protein M0D57_08655 [Sphingobacteriales bacterium JAD_PAG50586_3]